MFPLELCANILSQDTSLMNPADKYNMEDTHADLLNRQDAMEAEFATCATGVVRMHELNDERLEIQQTINEAQLSLNHAMRSLAERVDEFLCMWVTIRLSCSDVLRRGLDNRVVSCGAILAMWQKELRRRCLVCPVAAPLVRG